MDLTDFYNFEIRDEVFLINRDIYTNIITKLKLKEPFVITNIITTSSHIDIYINDFEMLPMYELIDSHKQSVSFYVYGYEIEF